MLVFQALIAQAAIEAGMKTPPAEQLDEMIEEPEGSRPVWDREEYPHFWVFCQLQLGRAMTGPTEHWENAKVIAAIPEEQLKTMFIEDHEKAGVVMVLG